MANTGILPVDTIEARRGAAVLLEVLRSEGCRYIFGNPGHDRARPDGRAHRRARHRLRAGACRRRAWSPWRTATPAPSGRPGFVNLHTAGGLGHGMGALINAQVSNTPLVVTAGQQDMRHNLTDPLLSGDLVKIAGPAMKWATEIISPDQIPVLVRRAFHDCTAAPSGPVFLSLPMNVMEQMSTVGNRRASRRSTGPPSRARSTCSRTCWPRSAPAASPSSRATKSRPPARVPRRWRWPRPSARRCSAPPGRRISRSRPRIRCGCGNLPTKASEIRDILGAL